MAADLPAVAVAVRDLCQRWHRGRAGTGLGCRPHSLRARLCPGGGQTKQGFCNPGAGDDRAVDRRVRRHRVAADAGVIARRHCLRQTRSVCARERSDEAIHASTCGAMDCFAALAMTKTEKPYFTSGQPESFAAGNALSPDTTASCL